MNEATFAIAMEQFFSVGVIGLLCVFLTPMVFGAITTYYCHKAQEKITEQVWREWREDETFQKQKVTSSINYND